VNGIPQTPIARVDMTHSFDNKDAKGTRSTQFFKQEARDLPGWAKHYYTARHGC
jgi:hypothetical protein